MSAASRFGAAIAQAGGGAEMRFWWVAALHNGPPKTMDLALTADDADDGVIAVAGARYCAAYASLTPGPAVGDQVIVFGSLPGGSSRTGGRSHGGLYVVVDKVIV